MTPREKAEYLVDTYRIVLMNEETQCGDEILCTGIAKQSAIIAVDEIINSTSWQYITNGLDYWNKVKHEIQKL
jgi:hypothetical protein